MLSQTVRISRTTDLAFLAGVFHEHKHLTGHWSSDAYLKYMRPTALVISQDALLILISWLVGASMFVARSGSPLCQIHCHFHFCCDVCWAKHLPQYSKSESRDTIYKNRNTVSGMWCFVQKIYDNRWFQNRNQGSLGREMNCSIGN